MVLLCASCNRLVQLSAQGPKPSNTSPSYKRIGVYFPPTTAPSKLLTSIDGDPLRVGKLEIIVDEATRGTILNALEAASAEVVVLDTMLDLRGIQRRKLDAFFWPKHINVRSSLYREGTLFPSYTAYAGVSLKLMRISGFKGILDSLDLNGSGSYYAHGIGSSRSGIAKLGAEIALRDLATRIVRALNRAQQ